MLVLFEGIMHQDMYRLYCQTGKPRILNDKELNLKYLLEAILCSESVSLILL